MILDRSRILNESNYSMDAASRATILEFSKGQLWGERLPNIHS